MKKTLATVFLILLFAPQALAQDKVDLTKNQVVMKVTGFEHTRGKVLCALHTRKGWLKAPIKRSVTKVQSDKTAECMFAMVPSGTYAIAVVHDENGDGKLERNFIGIPKEGVAMSNFTEMGMGPPDFDDAKFTYKGGRTTLTSPMMY